MKTFFTSDHHFSHENIIRYCKRPFSSVEEMNAEMIKAWNEIVKPEDFVWYLGDFSLWSGAVPKYLHLLNGEKHLISGNHDFTHPAKHKNNETKRQKAFGEYYRAGFKTIALESKIQIGGFSVKLHHMPYSNDSEFDQRYKDHRPKNEGGWLLCGHIHEKWKQQGRQINVGVDVWNFKPVSEDQILELIKSGPADR